MSENICVLCKEAYDIKETTYEQRMIADKDFCPICWHGEITAFGDDNIDFTCLEGLAK
jgi:hypothetical protein